ncbi:MAG: RNA methyltransferase [Bacteroidetes bacterium]|nr:RNA methyltransferase [Bacteroidota bacterium]
MIVKSQVKYIQSLAHKKYRDEEGVFVAEGPKIVNELLNNPAISPVNIFAISGWVEKDRSRISEKQLIEVSHAELDRISFLTTANQVLGIFKKPVFGKMNLKNKITLALDNIQDPGNAGTIVRIADWFGVEQVICSEDSADIFSPKVVQATMGSIARVQTSYTSLPEFISKHREIATYATVLDGADIKMVKPIKEGIIIIGNESKGISRELLGMVQHKITISRKGNAESLNAAVAAGIVLSHIAG